MKSSKSNNKIPVATKIFFEASFSCIVEERTAKECALYISVVGMKIKQLLNSEGEIHQLLGFI
jgi:hypothetical protein